MPSSDISYLHTTRDGIATDANTIFPEDGQRTEVRGCYKLSCNKEATDRAYRNGLIFIQRFKPSGNRTTCCNIKKLHFAHILCTCRTRLLDWVLSIYPHIITFLCPYNCYRLFRRLCIVAKSACYCRPVRPYFCPHVPARIQMEGFPWNLIMGTFMEICREYSNLVTIGQKCGALRMKN